MKPTSQEISHVSVHGSRTPQKDGSVVMQGRHPNSPDDLVTIRVKGGKVMESNVVRKPLKQMVAQSNAVTAKVKAKADRSKANKAAQLKKKQEKSALANNKNTKK